MKKIIGAVILFSCISLLHAKDPLSSGLDAYGRSDWSTAILSFRKAALDYPDNPDPLYWLVMSQISASEYAAALDAVNGFEQRFPREQRIPDITYQKGRIYYHLGWYEQSIQTFDSFIKNFSSHILVPSAWYWMGECLFSTGRFEEARAVFYVVLNQFPGAVKREPAHYRLLLLEQTYKEEELLAILKTSHEESLKIIEEYQRRERTYEQAITAYQKRISDMLKDTRLGELERLISDERAAATSLRDRNLLLERQNAELLELVSQFSGTSADSLLQGQTSTGSSDNVRLSIEQLRQKALMIQDATNEGDDR